MNTNPLIDVIEGELEEIRQALEALRTGHLNCEGRVQKVKELLGKIICDLPPALDRIVNQ